MADPTPDAAIIVYPTENELVEVFHIPAATASDYLKVREGILKNVAEGLTLPAEYVEALGGWPEPAQSNPRDDMAEVWREIMGEELGGESGHE